MKKIFVPILLAAVFAGASVFAAEGGKTTSFAADALKP